MPVATNPWADPRMHRRAPLWLALDQGGSASRALVFDHRGLAVAHARIDVAHARPRPGWVEQDPDAVMQSLREAADAAIAQLDAGQRQQVQAAGLVCQRSSLLAWDRETGAALSPVLSWQDVRAADWLAAQALDAEALHARTGLYPNAHYGLSKLRWCLDQLPAVQHAAVQGRLLIGPLAAFLVFGLLQERPARVDPANASRTLLFDLDRGDWADDLLQRFGIERHWLPAIARSDADYGELRLRTVSLPLRLLNGDQSAAAFAFGEPDPALAYANLGTGAFVYRVGIAQTPPRLLRSVIHWGASPQFAVEGTVNGAGSALAWFAQQQGIADASSDLDAHWPEAGEPPLFLNGIGGLGSPDWRADFASRFIGAGDASLQRVAIVESIAFLLQRNLERLRDRGPPLRGLVVSGGLSRSRRFCQLLADVSGLAVQRPGDCEASARGSAFLLAGLPGDWASLPVDAFTPRDNAALNARYARWTSVLLDALGDD
ncbi:MAG TPA: FGGY family carbohydrate kinase [Arenimonas sp.]|nr:FGGY family carbohydrate kinase [Arenimonas sp.]